MRNTIAERIQDFLKQFPPFDMLTKKELLSVSAQIRVLYVEKGDYIFKQDTSCHDEFYIVREGAVGLYREVNTEENLVDVCDTGDLFGLRIVIVKKNYRMSAKADEEAIVYAIPAKAFEPFIEENKEVNRFVLGTFAAHARNYYTETEKGKRIDNTISLEVKNDISELRSISYHKKPVTCLQEDAVVDVAKNMTKKKAGYVIVVDQNKYPIGIITDEDIRAKVATGLFSLESRVSEIMVAPVFTYSKKLTTVEAQVALIKHGINHLCITKDGTRNSKLIGILSEHDLLVSFGKNPSVLIKEIKRAKKIQRLRYIRKQVEKLLKSYLEQDIPTPHLLNIISEINEALVVRIVKLSLKEMNAKPPVKFSFMVLGSQGRREQLLLTDQDNALVFENVAEKDYETTQRYFLELTNRITKGLHTIGYEYCPAEMMASNSRWCMSQAKWEDQFKSWMTTPTEEGTLLSSIFFDFQYVYGDSNLVDRLAEVVFEGVNKSNRFLGLLGVSALQKPSPLGFFKQFLVEQNGDHKDTFDIKTRAMMVLIDAARILTLYHNLKGVNNTLQRYQKLAELEPKNAAVFDSCAKAFRVLIKFRTRQGLLQKDSGRFIKLNTLSKKDKLRLKRCFRPIRDIQELLRVRFQLKSLM
ncbi:DUF294 nucleotidyltransferase-like domain-containing protein [Aquimarina gracilis]|uniref:DUF294 nucleotidyltransferase-like domain-containing protein n=1 Tax=Aquimarina gracilis TaxID=874422 RepID=A0ABU5ZQD8_9FLAO|nr:DUF294 nucleotidyltransferase-like domain-containing protein [Aquimarina gracilis]MEB3344274.1 DUF294 nucleotidyltransferase-like domain-containing protein [Aquimarina gracilis]